MAVLAIRPALACDVDWIGPRLRPADRYEVLASMAIEPTRSLELAFEFSDQVWTGTADDVPACMFGVSCLDPLVGAGIPWLLGTDLVETHAIGFLRGSREIVAAMRREYMSLENHVDARNVRSIEWLRWLGFDIHEETPFGPFGAAFRRFSWGAK
jgi:hypothetical protein